MCGVGLLPRTIGPVLEQHWLQHFQRGCAAFQSPWTPERVGPHSKVPSEVLNSEDFIDFSMIFQGSLSRDTLDMKPYQPSGHVWATKGVI